MGVHPDDRRTGLAGDDTVDQRRRVPDPGEMCAHPAAGEGSHDPRRDPLLAFGIGGHVGYRQQLGEFGEQGSGVVSGGHDLRLGRLEALVQLPVESGELIPECLV